MPVTVSLHYNQKQVLFRAIKGYVQRQRARSLLDIGAGDGALAFRLATLVRTYVAIERDSTRADKLRRNGIHVIERTFPFRMMQTFDIVVVSHSVPEEEKHYQAFLREAWRRVRRGGRLLIITFKGVKTANRGATKDQRLFRRMLAILRSFGRPKAGTITSWIETRHKKTIIGVVRISDAMRNKSHRRVWRAGSRWYRIPTPHLVISMKKERTSPNR